MFVLFVRNKFTVRSPTFLREMIENIKTKQTNIRFELSEFLTFVQLVGETTTPNVQFVVTVSMFC